MVPEDNIVNKGLDVATQSGFKNQEIGAPGWFNQFSVCLWLRS